MYKSKRKARCVKTDERDRDEVVIAVPIPLTVDAETSMRAPTLKNDLAIEKKKYS